MVNDFEKTSETELVEELSKQKILQRSEFFKFISSTPEDTGKGQPHYSSHSQIIRTLWNSLGYEVMTKKTR